MGDAVLVGRSRQNLPRLKERGAAHVADGKKHKAATEHSRHAPPVAAMPGHSTAASASRAKRLTVNPQGRSSACRSQQAARRALGGREGHRRSDARRQDHDLAREPVGLHPHGRHPPPGQSGAPSRSKWSKCRPATISRKTTSRATRTSTRASSFRASACGRTRSASDGSSPCPGARTGCAPPCRSDRRRSAAARLRSAPAASRHRG